MLPALLSLVFILLLVCLLKERKARLKLQLKLCESEYRMRTVTQYLHNGTVAMFDRDFRYTMVHKLGLPQGMTPEQLEGKTIYEVVPPQALETIEAECKRVIAGETFNREWLYEGRWYLAKSCPVRDSQGEIVAGMVVTQDITTLKQTEAVQLEREKLQVALQKEQELHQLKNKMMIGISHEFRTPLSIVQSSSELLVRHLDRIPKERQQEHMAAIRGAIQQITKMLNEMSLVVRGQRHHETAIFAPCDLFKLCQDKAEQFKQAHSGYSVVVEGKALSLHSDPNLLAVALDHLIANAIKFSPDHKTVWLRLKAENGQMFLSICDQGIGIPAADQPHIFDPFYRGSNTGEIPGMGVGLNIVNDIVKLVNGKITVESQEGSGTTFTIALPS